jgi:hypothetical protein
MDNDVLLEGGMLMVDDCRAVTKASDWRGSDGGTDCCRVVLVGAKETRASQSRI